MPEVSIIMSVFNSKNDFLQQSIESMLKQSFADFEFIIVNDGSKDGIRIILEKYASLDGRIKLMKNEKNLGLTKSLNIAIKESRGRYIARMDDDDISLPNRIERQLSYSRSNNLDFIGCDCDFIDEIGKVMTEKRIVFPKNLKKRLFKGNFFNHSTFFGKTEVFENFYNEDFKKAQDYEFLLRIASMEHAIGYLNESLVLYRINRGGISAISAKEQEWYAIKARWKALCEYGYDKFYAIYFTRAFVSFLIPYWIKKFILYHK